MLLKYIEGHVFNNNKHYHFTNKDIKFDRMINSIIIPTEYIKEDIEDNISYLNSIYYDLIDRKLYSSINNIYRAIKNNTLYVYLSITYCTDISKSDNGYSIFMDNVKSLKQMDRYCSAVKYIYYPRTKEIERYEIYGDIVLGNEVKRDESYYDRFKPPKELEITEF